MLESSAGELGFMIATMLGEPQTEARANIAQPVLTKCVHVLRAEEQVANDCQSSRACSDRGSKPARGRFDGEYGYP